MMKIHLRTLYRSRTFPHHPGIPEHAYFSAEKSLCSRRRAPQGSVTPDGSVRSSRGFTLIEIMVAVAIFAIVMTVAAGSLLAVIEADHKAQAQKSVMNNLNFALESMSRMVRVGTRYHCGTITAPGLLENPADCPGGGTLFAFEGAGGDDADAADQIVFRLRSGQMEQSTDGGTSYLPFTAPEVVIEDMDFYVTGSDPGDNEQPRVILTVRGYAGVRRARSEFNVETSITQRILDR